MPEKTIYISYRPEQSLHVAQPLFNALNSMGYDVFMDIEAGVDDVNLRQIDAREHFVMLLSPGAIANERNPRLEAEFARAVESKRNMILLLTRDFAFEEEISNIQGPLADLKQLKFLRVQPNQIAHVIRLLDEDHLQNNARTRSKPTPAEDQATVREKLNKAREYTMQATIRLNTEKLFFQAVVKIRRGDFEEALADLDLVIADNPNNESAYLQRGRVLRKNGRKTAALRDYEQATKLSPKLVAAHIGRGELLLVTERFLQAQTAFENALKLQSESAPAIAGLALARYAQDDVSKGRELWSWLIERDRNYADAVWAGQVFDWEEALVERAQELLANA